MQPSVSDRLYLAVRTGALIVLSVVSFLAPRPLWAHGGPVALAFWGGYSAGVARCQSVISRAAARCIREVTNARRTCLERSMRGGGCDSRQLDAQVGQIRQAVLQIVGPACTSLELQQLRYVDASQAYRDIIDVCRRVDTAATSAMFAPAMVNGAVVQVSAGTQTCVGMAARASTRLLAFAVRVRQRVLDRIAASRLAPAEKQRLVTGSTEKVARLRHELRARLASACPDPSFMAVYGREIDGYLAGITAQADCHAQYIYLQDAVLCPPVVCGNGIQEPGEQCDDGKAGAGTGCQADCMRTSRLTGLFTTAR